MRRLAAFLLPALLACAPLAAATGGGAAAAQGFKLLRGARPAGMGGAYLAVASGADSILSNAAGLNQLRATQVTAGHMAWLDGVADDHLVVGMPIYGFGAWGLGMNYLWAQDQEYDNWGRPGGTFSDFDFSGQVAIAVQLPEDLNLGLTYKTLRQGYAYQFNMGSGFDLGLQWRDLFKALDLALAIQNFGTPLALGSDYALLPLAYKVGGAWRPAGLWLLALDYENQPVDHFNRWRLGLEAGHAFGNATAFVRLGYALGPENDLGDLAGASCGLGLALGAWQVDYALAPMGDLGLSHRVSLTFSSWLAH